MDEQEPQALPEQLSVLVCPFCGSAYPWKTSYININPWDYSTDRMCPQCLDVELLFLGMNAHSWSMRQDALKFFS